MKNPFAEAVKGLRGAFRRIDDAVSAERDEEIAEASQAATRAAILTAVEALAELMPQVANATAGKPIYLKIQLCNPGEDGAPE